MKWEEPSAYVNAFGVVTQAEFHDPRANMTLRLLKHKVHDMNIQIPYLINTKIVREGDELIVANQKRNKTGVDEFAEMMQSRRPAKRLRKHVIIAGKRTSAPQHSVPTAVLLMSLAPSWRLKDNTVTKLFGVGISRNYSLRAPATYRAILAGYVLINRSRLTPLK